MSIKLSKYYFLIFFFYTIYIYSQKKEKDQFKYYITKTQDSYQDYKYIQSLNYATKALEIAQKSSSSEMLAEAYVELSSIYSNLGLYKESLSYADKAQKEKFTQSKTIFKINLHNRKGYIYTGLGLYEFARKEYGEIIKLVPDNTTDASFVRQLSMAYELIGTSYGMENKSYDSLYKYCNKSISILKKCPEKDLYEELSLSYLQISQGFVEEKKFDSAWSYIDQSIKLIKKYDPQYPLFQHYEALGSFYYFKKEYKKSLTYYLTSLEMLKTYPQDEEYSTYIYKDIADSYHNLGQIEKEKEYLKIYAEKTELQLSENKKNTSYALKLIVEEEQKEKRTSTRHMYIFLLLFIPIIILLAWYYFKEKRKRRKIEYDSEKLLQIKEEETQTLKQKVNESFDEIIQLAKENHPHFWTRFQEVYPEFQTKLLAHCPELKTSELTFCAYVYLGFTTKEIATYTFKAIKTIENNRYNLRKKLNLAPEEDFLVWLQNQQYI
ncbi:tetratricopeptide (TPR) repeat protein [Chryseobacterium defluvii]|uniref:Tetratricopeptide (TPR) repeat protein n=1 Tax=Chryseobacterium defluvii TaxID=160396 RepID=A0A840KK20_9FLAO|nr:hypothetical protein [Chryseobacterium defluvii]MBB4807863.1 tetratricopeptide (TPR) repeat protein [Chryseobacterium defluvii]